LLWIGAILIFIGGICRFIFSRGICPTMGNL
jgi:hypothetical protein